MKEKTLLARRIGNSFQGALLVSFVFSMAGSVLNYFLQIVIGNMVSVEAFGEYNSINSLVVNISILFSPLAVMACQLTATNQTGDEKKSNGYFQILIISFIFCVCILLGGGMLYPVIRGKFGISNLEQWIVILCVICASGIYMIMLSIFQGMEKFGIYGAIGTLMIGTKLGISVFNLMHGMEVDGIVWSMLWSYMCMIIVMSLLLRKNTGRRNGLGKFFSGSKILELYGLTFVVQILASFYINGGEIILMGFLFDEQEVGLYSSAVMLGKICLYVVSMVSTVFFPKVAKLAGAGKDTKIMFYKTIGVSIGVSLVYSVFLLIGGERAIPLLFGHRYDAALEYINAVVIFMIPLSTLSVIHYYFLGVGKIKEYAGMLACVTVIAIGIIVIFASNIIWIPVVLGAGLYAVLAWSIIYIKNYCENNMEGNEKYEATKN